MHNLVDVAFVVDTTGSMGSFLSSAKHRMAEVLKAMAKTGSIDLRAVLIDYRDHPPEDATYASKNQTGTDPVSVDRFGEVLRDLQLGSGGDTAESVLDGVDELVKVNWRPHARKIAFLVGDAAGHGGYQGGADHWPLGCPCGRTIEDVSARIEQAGILLYGIVLNNSQETTQYFKAISGYTGGQVLYGSGIAEVETLLKKEFGNLGTDEMVLDVIQKDPTGWSIEGLSTALNMSSGDVDGSVRRLLGRDLVADPSVVA